MPQHKFGSLPTNELLLQIGAGSKRAFETLYDQLAPSIFSAAIASLNNHGTAAKATETVFLDIWRTSPQYAQSRDDPTTWLLTLVREAIRAHEAEHGIRSTSVGS